MLLCAITSRRAAVKDYFIHCYFNESLDFSTFKTFREISITLLCICVERHEGAKWLVKFQQSTSQMATPIPDLEGLLTSSPVKKIKLPFLHE